MSQTGFIAPKQQLAPTVVEAVADVYANQIRLGATLADFTIIFGLTYDIGGGDVVNRDRVVVRLSPQTLKTLSLQIDAALGAYEAAVGQVPVPERVLTQLAATKEAMVAAYEDQMTSKADPQPG